MKKKIKSAIDQVMEELIIIPATEFKEKLYAASKRQKTKALAYAFDPEWDEVTTQAGSILVGK